jgi:hypothetical protein
MIIQNNRTGTPTRRDFEQVTHPARLKEQYHETRPDVKREISDFGEDLSWPIDEGWPFLTAWAEGAEFAIENGNF